MPYSGNGSYHRRQQRRRAEKVDWRDPMVRAHLAQAYKRAGGNNEKAARILGVSVGSARLANRLLNNHRPSTWRR